MAGKTRTTDAVEPVQDAAVSSSRALDTIPESMVKRSSWDEEALRELSSFDAAVALVADEHGGIVLAHEDLGDGFALLDSKHKDRLVGVPLLFMEWNFNEGDNGMFVSVRVAARNNDGSVSKYILNDGGTGIAEQLANYTKRTGKQGGLLAKNGLRRSDYDYEDPNTGERSPASTFYIDLSA